MLDFNNSRSLSGFDCHQGSEQTKRTSSLHYCFCVYSQLTTTVTISWCCVACVFSLGSLMFLIQMLQVQMDTKTHKQNKHGYVCTHLLYMYMVNYGFLHQPTISWRRCWENSPLLNIRKCMAYIIFIAKSSTYLSTNIYHIHTYIIRICEDSYLTYILELWRHISPHHLFVHHLQTDHHEFCLPFQGA